MNPETQFSEIVGLIRQARANAYKAVNKELINCYWKVGEYICQRTATSNWGDKAINDLAKFIGKSHPDLKGYDRRGLYRMKQFYDTYKNSLFVTPVVTQLQNIDNQMINLQALTDIRDCILCKISWTHHLIILSRTRTEEEREFYIHLCVKENYSKRELDRQISSGVFERAMLGHQKLPQQVKELNKTQAATFRGMSRPVGSCAAAPPEMNSIPPLLKCRMHGLEARTIFTGISKKFTVKLFFTQTPKLLFFAFAFLTLSLADTDADAQCSYFTRIVSGCSSTHALGIKSDGTLWAWGDNMFGELGDGSANESNAPEQIGTRTNWVDIATGAYFSLGITSDGKLWAWGINGVGQLGDGTANPSLVPEQIIGPDSNWIAVAACESHSFGITADGKLWAWGYGVLGDPSGNSSDVPIQIGTDTDWATISTGNYHTLALKKNGALWAWGINAQGELGDGSNNGSIVYTPEHIGTATNWIKIAAGYSHSLGITADGKLWAWGENNEGELGDGTTVDGTSGPEQIGTATNWVAISGGNTHSLGITADGKLWAWGQNNEGELGDGTNTDTLRPEQIATAANWKEIVAGSETSFGLTGAGISWSWGVNDVGQLGDGTIIRNIIPATIGVPVYTGLAATGSSNTLYQQTLSNYATDCANLIATVAQSGSTPVSGITTAMLWIDGSVQVNANGKPYLQRHYQITPAANASTATATITLYFSQADFTAYNADPVVAGGGYPLLPVDSADVQGYKANLNFTKISGVSGDGSGAPGSYSGTATIITPTSVGYQNGRWEVSFSTAGFSGFFAGSGSGTLPLTWIAVTGMLDDQGHATIDWKVQEHNVVSYSVEKSVGSGSFVPLGTVAGKGDGLNSYQFKETETLAGTAFYRIRQTDFDGKLSYSIVMKLDATSDAGSLSLFPNPGSDHLFIDGLQGNEMYRAVVTDLLGHVILQKEISSGQNEIFMDALSRGAYLIKIMGNGMVTTLKFVKR